MHRERDKSSARKPAHPSPKPADFLPALPPPPDPDAPSVWDIAREITADVPDEVWESFPRDGSINIDHYLYGTPKVHA